MRINEIAAYIHRRMVDDDRFGYSWEERYGAIWETWEINGKQYRIKVGDYECGTSVKTAWATALQGTPWEGCLEGYVYSANCREIFVGSGLFDWVPISYAGEGDVYLNIQNHVAMCQPDGQLSEFSWGDNGAYGNQRGDQSGHEAYMHAFYHYPWDGCLKYNGKADVQPEQVPGEPFNDMGLKYQAHVQDLGWCDPVRDGQIAGTTGFAKRLEAIELIDVPEGIEISCKGHVQNVGWQDYGVARHGKPVTMGTTGKEQRMEAVIFSVLSNTTGKKLEYRAHQQDYGWLSWTPAGFMTGCDGQERRLEAFQMRLV